MLFRGLIAALTGCGVQFVRSGAMGNTANISTAASSVVECWMFITEELIGKEENSINKDLVIVENRERRLN